MSVRKKRAGEVTCYCFSHNFPHRFDTRTCVVEEPMTAKQRRQDDEEADLLENHPHVATGEYAVERQLFDRDMARYCNDLNRKTR